MVPSEMVGFVGVGSAFVLGWGTVLWKVSSGHAKLSTRFDATEREVKVIREKLGMNGGGPDASVYVTRGACEGTTGRLQEVLRENAEATAREFKTIREMMETERIIMERRFADQSSRLLHLAEASGVRFRYDKDNPDTREP